MSKALFKIFNHYSCSLEHLSRVMRFSRSRSQIWLRQWRKNYWYRLSWKNVRCFQGTVKVSLHNNIQSIPRQYDISCPDLGSWPPHSPGFELHGFQTKSGTHRINMLAEKLYLKVCVSPGNGLWDLIWDSAHLPLIGSSKISLNRLFWPYLNRERENPFQEGNHQKSILTFR